MNSIEPDGIISNKTKRWIKANKTDVFFMVLIVTVAIVGSILAIMTEM